MKIIPYRILWLVLSLNIPPRAIHLLFLSISSQGRRQIDLAFDLNKAKLAFQQDMDN
jgi:hypothetical protein